MDFQSEYFPERDRPRRRPIQFTTLAKVLAFLASGAICTGMLLKMTGHELPEVIASPAVAGGGIFLALLYYLSMGKIGSACFDYRRKMSHRVVLGVCFVVMLAAISYMLVGYLLTLLTGETELATVYSPSILRDNLGLTIACGAFVLLLDAIVFGANFLELSDQAVQEPELRRKLAEATEEISRLQSTSRELDIRSSELENQHREQVEALRAEAKAQLSQSLDEKQLELDRIVEVAMNGAASDLEVFRLLWDAGEAVEARRLREASGKDVQVMLARLLERGDVERIRAPKEYRSDWLWRALRERRNGSESPAEPPAPALGEETQIHKEVA